MRSHLVSAMVALLFGLTVWAEAGDSHSTGPDSEARRADSVLLNGTWEVALGEGDEDAYRVGGGTGLSWASAILPGPGAIVPWTERNATEIKFAWVRRRFYVSQAQAERLAVLRWNRIQFGATAYINGQKVGANEPTGPYQVILPSGLLRAGENEIVLKIAGAAGVRKSKTGYLLIPAGFSTRSGKGIPAVTDDIWIDFADRAYMKWALAVPDLAGSVAHTRVALAGNESAGDLTIRAEVAPWPHGDVLGRGACAARLVPNSDPLSEEYFTVDVPMPRFKPWSQEEPNLYLAHLVLEQAGRALDELSFRFGMRQIGVEDGDFRLNGEDLRLRGSELVAEWNWGDMITGKEKNYLVTDAREMSMNAFRTHTEPPPKRIADVCDEYGTFLLVEFPCLWNTTDYHFTPEEYEIWHRNVLTDAAGWMERLWNHPSVAIWVLSNESPVEGEWEKGPYRDLVRRLDPTRPTIRSGSRWTTGTAENLDIHTCHNEERPDEGHLQEEIPSWFEEAAGRTLTNSEYMNYRLDDRPLTQWTGVEDAAADLVATGQIGMEHTEAMRRARLDAILPYMYAGWTRTQRESRGGKMWRAGYAHPWAAVWHSSLAPVLASLDLFDPDYLTGQQVTTDLYLINDSWQDAAIGVDLLLTNEDPEFIPEAECFTHPVVQWHHAFEVAANSVTIRPITWRVPEAEGSYWLTARTTGASERPVLSQRFIRAIAPKPVPDSARRRTFVLLGADETARQHFRSLGLKTSDYHRKLRPGEDVVIVWDAAQLTAEEKAAAPALLRFVADGGRVIVLSTVDWNWPEVCAMDRPEATEWWGLLPYSRAFAYTGVQHPMLKGIPRAWLMRWNGLPGTVAGAPLQGPSMDEARPILWVREPGRTVVAEVPTVTDEGTILFCQLDLRRRLNHESPYYDPAAERIWFNLLGM